MEGSLKRKESIDTGLPNTSPRSDTSEPPQPGMRYPPPPEDNSVSSLKKNLEYARRYDAAGPWGKMNTYRVPHCLGDPKREKKAYIPRVVSFGPYHHGETHLRPMELHKWRALNNILKRTHQKLQPYLDSMTELEDRALKFYLDSMKELEDRALACYEGPLKLSSNGFAEMMMYEGQLKLSSNEFAEMMMLDGCFVLELFRGYARGFEVLGYAWNDPVFSIKGKIESIRREMLMLENQIPLIVLGKLLQLQLSLPNLAEAEVEVARLAQHFFIPLMQSDEPSTIIDITKLRSLTRDPTTSDPPSANVGLHCLDVFRKCLLYKGPDHVPRNGSRDSHEADERSQQPIHCATDLKDAGIKFRKHKTDRLWDIQFNNRVLYIPPIRIDDSTESLLRNLIAFEQCHLDCKKDITDYVAFLDDLINSEEDVRYLRRHKIMENWLGSDIEVADLVNSLCQEVLSGDSYSKLYEEINEHYDRKWNIWRSTLKRKYFSNPWAILSLVAAVFLLLMTAAQTFCTVYGYYMPRK